MDPVISDNENTLLQIQFKLVGSGKKVDRAVTCPSLTAPFFLDGSDTDVRIGPAAPDLSDANQQFTLARVVAGAPA